MYNGGGEAKPELQKENPLTQNMVQFFMELNDRQEKTASEIQNKLHSILNLRQPESGKAESEGKKMQSDFVSTMQAQFSRMTNMNNRLAGILMHLEKIV